jgi:hypothetical protein
MVHFNYDNRAPRDMGECDMCYNLCGGSWAPQLNPFMALRPSSWWSPIEAAMLACEEPIDHLIRDSPSG